MHRAASTHSSVVRCAWLKSRQWLVSRCSTPPSMTFIIRRKSAAHTGPTTPSGYVSCGSIAYSAKRIILRVSSQVLIDDLKSSLVSRQQLERKPLWLCVKASSIVVQWWIYLGTALIPSPGNIASPGYPSGKKIQIPLGNVLARANTST